MKRHKEVLRLIVDLVRGFAYTSAYSTAEISYVSTVSRCCIAKSSPLLDSSCRDGHRNMVSATWDALLKSLIDK